MGIFDKIKQKILIRKNPDELFPVDDRVIYLVSMAHDQLENGDACQFIMIAKDEAECKAEAAKLNWSPDDERNEKIKNISTSLETDGKVKYEVICDNATVLPWLWILTITPTEKDEDKTEYTYLINTQNDAGLQTILLGGEGFDKELVLPPETSKYIVQNFKDILDKNNEVGQKYHLIPIYDKNPSVPVLAEIRLNQ